MDDEPLAITNNLERYIAILDIFAGLQGDIQLESGTSHEGNLALGVADVSTELGISKGTVSRYLRRLESVEVLTRLPDKRYQLTSKVFFWGQAARPKSNIQTAARPVMTALAKKFGEPVSLFVLVDKKAVCIDQVDGSQPVRLNAQVGRQLPLNSGSSPRLLLAYASEELQAEVINDAPHPRITSQTLSTAIEIQAALEETRAKGYVVSVSESNDGVVGIAAPIRDENGQVIASLSVAGPETRINGEWRDQCIAGVRDATQRISRSLGYLQPIMEGV